MIIEICFAVISLKIHNYAGLSFLRSVIVRSLTLLVKDASDMHTLLMTKLKARGKCKCKGKT